MRDEHGNEPKKDALVYKVCHHYHERDVSPYEQQQYQMVEQELNH